MNDVPQQGNGYNFGVFTCIFALLLSVDRPLSFDQQFINGQEYRNGIGLSILREVLGDVFNEYIIRIGKNL